MLQTLTTLGSSLSYILFGCENEKEVSSGSVHEREDLNQWKKKFDVSANKLIQIVSTRETFIQEDLDIVNRLIELINNISKFAPEHDYKNIGYNGFRSIVKLWAKVFEAASKIESMDELKQFVSAMRRIEFLFDHLEDYHNQNQASKYNHEEQSKLIRKFIGVFEDGKMQEVLYSPPFRLIQFRSSFALLLKLAFRFSSVIFPGLSLTDRLRGLMSERGSAKSLSKFACNLATPDLKFGLSMCDPLMWTFNAGIDMVYKITNSNTHITNVTTNIRSQYWIDLSDDGLKFNKCAKYSEVRYQVARTDPVGGCGQFEKKILIYCHGGGFFGPKAHCFENLCIRKWTEEIPGLTIVNFDYSPCPEDRFPTQVQELLDFYLWLTSPLTRQEVADTFGFVPREIAFQGESAGGSVSMSFIVALNEIRDLFDKSICLPKALVLSYPKITHSFQFWPSILFSLFDPLIMPQLMTLVIHAYVPSKVYDKVSGAYKLVAKAEQIKMDPLSIVGENSTTVQNILIDPFKYDKLGSISDTRLYILSGEFDLFLDEAIVLAKIWKGEVDLRVTDNVGHSANMFRLLHPDTQKAHDELVDLIKKAFSK